MVGFNKERDENIIDNFKRQIYEGKPVYGPFMKSGDAAFVETTGYAGFEFAILDMEHGPVSLETMQIMFVRLR